MDGGSLDLVVKTSDKICEQVFEEVALAVLCGLTYLRENHQIIHRDLTKSYIFKFLEITVIKVSVLMRIWNFSVWVAKSVVSVVFLSCFGLFYIYLIVTNPYLQKIIALEGIFMEKYINLRIPAPFQIPFRICRFPWSTR